MKISKKMRIGLLVAIAAGLVLGSVPNMQPQVEAAETRPTGLLYYYSFEEGYNTGVAWNNPYGSTNINMQKWNNLEHYDSTLNNLVEVSGTGVTPELYDGSPSRSGARSMGFNNIDGIPWTREITDA